MLNWFIIMLFALALLPGIVGVIIPVLPGLPYMFVVAVIYGFVNHFQALTGMELLWLAGLTVLSIIVDYLAGILGASFGGATGWSVGIGMIGFIIGMLLLPPFGGPIGLFLAVLLAELYQFRKAQAFKAATGALIGSAVGMLINLLLAFGFVTLFVVFALSK